MPTCSVPLKGTIAGFVGNTGKVVNIGDCYNDETVDEANSADGIIVRPKWAGHDFDKKTNFKTRNMLVLPIMIGGWNDFEPFNKEVRPRAAPLTLRVWSGRRSGC
eukprot:SAG22_NODE_842_length_6892_cov_10.369645_6_plen_105_part_00